MSLQFIIGRAGSGKTYHCREAIVRELLHEAAPRSRPLVWLLPEQAAAQAEATILSHPDVQGWTRLRVLSFRRLARLVIEESGGNPRPFLDEQGRLMLLRALTAKCRDKLQLFGPSAGAPGFIDRLARTFTELAQYGHSFEELEHCIKDMEGNPDEQLLRRKLHDLHVLGKAYEQSLGERFANPDHYLNHLAEQLPKSRIICDADVWIDGFASFTPEELRVLAGIIRQAHQTQLALLMNPEDIEGLTVRENVEAARLFSQTEETFLRVQALAIDSDVMIEEPLLLPKTDHPTRMSHTPRLAAMERALAENDFMPTGADGDERTQPRERGLPESLPDVLFLECQTRREEVEAIARMIRRLVRNEQWRYRDIAVIARDLGPYENLIKDAFERHTIPCFLDKRRSVAHHPLVELLRSALRAVLGDYRHEDMIHCMKTDLLPLSRREVDKIENASLEYGWRGRKSWIDAPLPEKISYLSEARKKSFAPLATLQNALREKTIPMSAADFVGALLDFLDSIDAARTMAHWTHRAEEEGRIDDAEEHRQVWDYLTALLLQMNESLKGEALPPQDLADTIETGLETLTLALAPPTPDQVLVSSIERSRQPDLRAAFVIGMNEQFFPRVAAEDVILNDHERETLETHAGGVEMAATSTVRMLRERYLAYVAATRSSQHLCLSWATTSETGGALRPSSYLETLRRAATLNASVPTERRVEADTLSADPGVIETRNQIMQQVVMATREHDAAPTPHDKLWRSVAEHSALKVPSVKRRAALGQLQPELASALFARHPDLSVSRLETAGRCPFQYFANYTLNLKERKLFEVGALEIGSFHHAVLERLFHLLGERFGQPPTEGARALANGRALNWGEVDLQHALASLDEAIEECRDEFLNSDAIEAPRADFLIRRSRRQLGHAVESLCAAGHEDSFVQIAAEVSFGTADNTLAAYPLLQDDPPSRLRGVIDRVDVAHDSTGLWLRVFDYKSSARRLFAHEVLGGLALQLPLYLRVLRDIAGGWRTAGAFFYALQPTLSSASAPPPSGTQNSVRLQANGLWAEDALPLLTSNQGLGNAHLAISITSKGALSKPRSTDGWLPNGLLDTLIERADICAKRLAQEIRSGEISVRPFAQGSQTGCAWCAYRDVCRFDPAFDCYNTIPKLKRDEVLDILKT